jgi:hypothetical protein
MKATRVFLPQEAVDSWLSQHRIEIQGSMMTLIKEQKQFELKSAVHFVEELTGEKDSAALVGKVKGLDELAELGAELCSDSVVLGDNAYRVIEGFLGEVIQGDQAASQQRYRKSTVPELDLLTRFFLGKS